MSELPYVAIYCEMRRKREAEAARERKPWNPDIRERSRRYAVDSAGLCYAAPVRGGWRCLCCGTPIQVVI